MITLRKKTELKPSNGFQVKMAIPSLFDEEARKVGEFIMVCKLYLKVKEKWKYIGEFESKNTRVWNSGRIFRRNKKEFGDGDKELKEIAELKKLEQDQQTIDEHFQMFKRTVRDSRYRERPLIKKFKREIDRRIRRWLMEIKYPPKSINGTKEQQY